MYDTLFGVIVNKVIKKSKTLKLLSAYYSITKNTGTIIYDSQCQYSWEHKRYQWAYYQMSYKDFKYLLQQLCERLNVKMPKIYVYKYGYKKRTATSLVVDGKLLLSDKTMMMPVVCVHEFVHFYLWDKYKHIEGHNTNKMKSMIDSIMKTIEPEYHIHEYTKRA